MKKIITVLSLLVICLFFVRSTNAITYPSPSGYVNDFANIYSSGFKTQLEGQLAGFEKQTSAEISVVTLKFLEGEDINLYANELFKKWGIGKKGKDNGLLVLIVKNDRKAWVEVGYGLEPYLNDSRVGEILRSQMFPQFKKNDYEAGTINTIISLEKYISDKDIAPAVQNKKSADPLANGGGVLEAVIVIFFIVMTYLASFLGRTKEIWPGGLLGAVVGGIGGYILSGIVLTIILVLIGGGLGLFFDYILSKNYRERKSRGLPTTWWGSGGGFGGGGSGGGFGGFGGGSSGGGGSGGSW